MKMKTNLPKFVRCHKNRGKFIALDAYIRKKERSKINNLKFPSQEARKRRAN